MNIKENDQKYIVGTYARNDTILTHGENALVYDEQEKEYIDCTAGIGVNSLGFANAEWNKAICEQAEKLAHTSNLFYTQPCVEVAKMLCEKSGMKKIFFANSGAEANEGAIKVARKYSFDKYGKDRHTILTLVNSFHGRTITTLAATGQDHFHQFFDPFTPGFDYANANDFEDLKAKVNEKTCAIMLELIQGEGGVLPLDKKYVKAIARLCKEQDILLIIDEVQTGIGRTGSLFAYQQFDIQPDMVTSAKGLGNGLPIGAILFNHKVEHTFGYGDHGTTFGGNPIACAGAMVVLKHMNETLYKEVLEKGEYIKERFLKMPHVLQVNGMGLMRGIELSNVPVKELIEKCMDKGVLLLNAKDRLRLLPPLTITKKDLKKALDIIADVLTSWEG